MKRNTIMTFLILLALLTTSCKHKKYYDCSCSSRKDTGSAAYPGFYSLGEIQQSQAQQQCFIHNTGTDTCVLITHD